MFDLNVRTKHEVTGFDTDSNGSLNGHEDLSYDFYCELGQASYTGRVLKQNGV